MSEDQEIVVSKQKVKATDLNYLDRSRALKLLIKAEANPVQMLNSCPLNVQDAYRGKQCVCLISAQCYHINICCRIFLSLDLILTKAAEAQQLVNEETLSENFCEANRLVEDLQISGNEKNSCMHDVALVLKTIANTEKHPKPELVGGIDLK